MNPRPTSPTTKPTGLTIETKYKPGEVTGQGSRLRKSA
jgi:hypothetical protein